MEPFALGEFFGRMFHYHRNTHRDKNDRALAWRWHWEVRWYYATTTIRMRGEAKTWIGAVWAARRQSRTSKTGMPSRGLVI